MYVWVCVHVCVCVYVCVYVRVFLCVSALVISPEAKQHVVSVTVWVGLTLHVSRGQYILQPHQYTFRLSEIRSQSVQS